MSIIKNGKNIIGVYKGDIPILKIFKHNNLVYQHSSTGGTETQYDITSTFNVTSTTSPTQLCYSSATSAFTEMYVDSVQVDVTSGYTFNTTGEHTVGYTLSDKTTIGYEYFRECQNLLSVTIGSGVKTVGPSSFYYCLNLSSVKIPDSVENIERFTFGACYGLKTIEIPSSVTTIGQDAFYNCESLTSITIPSSVTSIHSYAFEGCYFHKDNFINNSSAKYYPWSAVIYDTIQDDGLYILETTAVKCKQDAKNVTIPSSITNIGDSAFNGCGALKSVTIPDSVTTIGNYAFYNCGRLSSITIPSSITNIGDEAFNSCSSLNEITCLATTAPTLGASVFNYLPSNGTLTYPCESDYSTWLEQLRWKDTCNQGGQGGQEGWVTLTQDTSRNIQMQTFRIDTTEPPMSSGEYFITFSTEPDYLGENADITEFSICINEDRIFDNGSRKHITEQTHIEGNVYEYTFSVPIYFAGGERNAPLSQVQYKGTIEETPGEEVSPYDITAKFDVTSTNSQTVICFSAYTSAFTEMYVDDVLVSPTSAYTFSSIGEHTVGYMLKDKTKLAGSMMNGHFRGCVRMKEIKFKDELTTISGPTFSGCTSLQNVTFGSGLTSVGISTGFTFSIFTGCTSLREITCFAPTAPTLLKKSIQGVEKNNGVLYIPQGSDYRTWTSILTTWNVQYIT